MWAGHTYYTDEIETFNQRYYDSQLFCQRHTHTHTHTHREREREGEGKKKGEVCQNLVGWLYVTFLINIGIEHIPSR